MSSGVSNVTAESTQVGRQLRQAREGRSLTLEHAAQSTRIRAHYLQALEEGNLSALPSNAQARGFLRAYASFLKLDADALLKTLDSSQTAVVPGIARPGGEIQPPAPAESQDAETVRLAQVPLASPPSTDGLEEPLETIPKTIPLSSEPPPVDETPLAQDIGPVEDSEDEGPDPIFAGIGLRLRRQRELLGLSLEDVERHTHLRHHYLVALEAGKLEGLPSPVQGRGMLNNYAAFLGLDPESLLLRFADGLQARLVARQAAQKSSRPAARHRKATLPAPLRRILSMDIVIGGAIALLLIIFIGWGAMRIMAMRNQQSPTSTAPSIAEVLLATATPTITLTPLPVTPTNPASQLLPPPAMATDALSGQPFPANAEGKVLIYVTVRQRAWMRVLVDGKAEFEGRVAPGTAFTYVGESQVEILTGNGAAIQVFYNQRDLGPLGTFGQVVDRIFTLQGIFTPTPTITPTPTETLPVTPTSPSTATPQPGQATAPALP